MKQHDLFFLYGSKSIPYISPDKWYKIPLVLMASKWGVRGSGVTRISIDGRVYAVKIYRQAAQPSDASRLIIVSFQPNELAKQVLRVCIQAIQRYTPEPHEVWVVDNNSPAEHKRWLLQWPEINVVFNQTEPMSPSSLTLPSRLSTCAKILRSAVATRTLSPDTFVDLINGLRGKYQQTSGSYANAIGLEIAVRLVDPATHYLMTLHMDTMPCRTGWLSFLRSKFNDRIRAAGVRMDKKPHRTPEGVLHVLGTLVDFQLFQQLELDFLPHLPRYDVGDCVTVALRDAGYDVFACRNTLRQPDLVDKIPSSPPLRHLNVDRSLDDDGNVIFLHLGRGVGKAVGKRTKKTGPTAWVKFADEYLLTASRKRQ
jgi:hypothetical protein